MANSDAAEVPESFSPDGRYLVYDRRSLSGSQNSNDIWVLPLVGDGKPFPIVQTPFDDTGPALSPNGKWMAYESNESGRNEIYITGFPSGGAKWQVSINGGMTAQGAVTARSCFSSTPLTT